MCCPPRTPMRCPDGKLGRVERFCGRVECLEGFGGWCLKSGAWQMIWEAREGREAFFHLRTCARATHGFDCCPIKKSSRKFLRKPSLPSLASLKGKNKRETKGLRGGCLWEGRNLRNRYPPFPP